MRSILSISLLGMTLAVAGLFPQAATADDTWLCGDKIIMIGAKQAEVLENCGEPTSKTADTDAMREGRYYQGTAPVEHWTYATDTVTRVLTFDQGVLVSMDTD
ncbi:MAG: DUF2845 domain-containing protein [Steroidobacteraceae bacterium]|nr:DUF2845 domain-containing protein [Steroidobacteraceae bacterium]